MRIGIFGGTFNPPHIGHLVCAGEALWQLELDRVVLMPVGEAPHRDIEADPGREARFGLCRAAVEGNRQFDVSRFEIDKDAPAFTAQTLEQLREDSPADELFFIMGGDAAASLPSWYRPERVLALATVAVAERDMARKEVISAAAAGVEGARRIKYFDMPRVEVSSTLVRERVQAGLPYRHLVPEPVASRIMQEGLYAGSTRTQEKRA